MSRKHVLQKVLLETVEPPSEGQHIVMAVGSRGSNIIEVRMYGGSSCYCTISTNTSTNTKQTIHPTYVG